MKKIFLICTALLLAGCVSALKQVNVPTHIVYNKQSYQLAEQQDLGQIAHYVYYPVKQSALNWQQKIEVLFDRNGLAWSLQDRIDFRTRTFANNGVKYFKFEQQNDTLWAYVIYEPSEQNKDWQVDVSRGSQIANCGYVQYQYSLKISQTAKFKNMNAARIASYLTKFVVNKELVQLQKMPWTLQCQK